MGNIWGIIKTTLNSLTSFKETNINNKTAVTWYSRISAAKIYLLLTKTKEQIKSTKLDNICFQEVQVINTNKNSHQPYSASGQDYLMAFE